MSVIEIKLHEELPTNNQNKLRYRMELAVWRACWREAEAAKDYERLDRLDREYELVGFP